MVRPVCLCQRLFLGSLSPLCTSQGKGLHTGRKGLLQLLGLVAVLEDKGVEVVAAADLELDLLVGVLLHAHSCENRSISRMFTISPPIPQIKSFVHACVLRKCARPVIPPEFLLFLQSSIPPALWTKHTGSILAAADLDEALDVGDFAGHVGGIV